MHGRGAAELDEWLTDQPEEWKSVVAITVCDLHEPFRAALKAQLPDATTVAGHGGNLNCGRADLSLPVSRFGQLAVAVPIRLALPGVGELEC